MDLRQVGGNVGGGQAQSRKTDVIVGPVATVIGAIWRAFALVQFGADQYINHQPVFQVHAPDLARWQCGMPAQLTNNMDRVIAVDHLRVARNQHPHIMQMAHGTRQRGGHIAQAAGFNQIGQLGGHKQDFLFVGVVGDFRRYRHCCFTCRGLARSGDHLINQRSEAIVWVWCSSTDHDVPPCIY